jgi:hypothetical protein
MTSHEPSMFDQFDFLFGELDHQPGKFAALTVSATREMAPMNNDDKNTVQNESSVPRFLNTAGGNLSDLPMTTRNNPLRARTDLSIPIPKNDSFHASTAVRAVSSNAGSNSPQDSSYQHTADPFDSTFNMTGLPSPSTNSELWSPIPDLTSPGMFTHRSQQSFAGLPLSISASQPYETNLCNPFAINGTSYGGRSNSIAYGSSSPLFPSEIQSPSAFSTDFANIDDAGNFDPFPFTTQNNSPNSTAMTSQTSQDSFESSMGHHVAPLQLRINGAFGPPSGGFVGLGISPTSPDMSVPMVRTTTSDSNVESGQFDAKRIVSGRNVVRTSPTRRRSPISSTGSNTATLTRAKGNGISKTRNRKATNPNPASGSFHFISPLGPEDGREISAGVAKSGSHKTNKRREEESKAKQQHYIKMLRGQGWSEAQIDEVLQDRGQTQHSS